MTYTPEGDRLHALFLKGLARLRGEDEEPETGFLWLRNEAEWKAGMVTDDQS